jgi:ribonuclease E
VEVAAEEPVVAVEASLEPVVDGEEPVVPAADDDPRNRRRGRRGGRRRRREDGELSPFAVPGADQPDLLPVYAGPTPADPFGGRAFDIFDVMDQVERAAEAMPVARPAPAAEIVNAAAPEPVSVAEEVVAPPVEVAAAEETVEIVNSAAPEPVIEAALATVEEPAPLVPANDVVASVAEPEPPPPAPVIKPILVGAEGDAPAEKKRGWWRR